MGQRKSKERRDRFCAIPGCTVEVPPRRQYCNFHAMTLELVDSGKRAIGRGDYATGIFSGIISTLLDAGIKHAQKSPEINKYVDLDQIGNFAEHRIKNPPPPRPPRSKKNITSEAFSFLGLDPKSSTEKDIRNMQRELAKIYHADKGGDRFKEDKLKEINSAVEVCLNHVRSKEEK